jgi:hypothetical protein
MGEILTTQLEVLREYLVKNKLSREALLVKKLIKRSSKIGLKHARGLNFSNALEELKSEKLPSSREDIKKRLEADPMFSDDDLREIFEISIPPALEKNLSKKEKVFIEIGMFLLDSRASLPQVKDYLDLNEQFKQPGDLSKIVDVDITDLGKIEDGFRTLDNLQIAWHQQVAAEGRANDEGDRYLTNEIIHSFGDGWNVVYVPAAGEGPPYKDREELSNDRIVEGNLNGLCLGSATELYQDNRQGKIFSVRDPSNEPKVTIRIHSNALEEAKGKNNLPPGIEAARHGKEWFEIVPGLIYKNNYDYEGFPPTTIEAVKKIIDTEVSYGGKGSIDNLYKNDWIVHWYNNGVSSLDEDVAQKIKENNKLVFPLSRKYKELIEPVVKFYAEDFITSGVKVLYTMRDSQTGNPIFDDQRSQVWKTYKKEDWMQSAVKKLSEFSMTPIFMNNIHKYPEYNSFLKPKIIEISKTEPAQFFRFELHKIYHELGEASARNLIKKDPLGFFKFELQNVYEELGKSGAEGLSKANPEYFFLYELDFIYPEHSKAAAINLIKTNPGKFILGRAISIHRKLLKENPDLAKHLLEHAPSEFVEAGLVNEFPELADIAYKKYSFSNPGYYFRTDLEQKHPEWGETIAVNLIKQKNYNAYIYYELYKKYPHLADLFVQSVINHDLKEYYRYDINHIFPQYGREIAEKIKDTEPRFFYSKGLDKKYPDLVKDLDPGSKVKFLSGPFTSMTGYVVSSDESGTEYTISVRVFSQTIEVPNISISMIEPVL